MTTAIATGRVTPSAESTNEELTNSFIAINKKIAAWKKDFEETFTKYRNLASDVLKGKEYLILTHYYVVMIQGIEKQLKKFEFEAISIKKIAKERKLELEPVNNE